MERICKHFPSSQLEISILPSSMRAYFPSVYVFRNEIREKTGVGRSKSLELTTNEYFEEF